MSIVWATQEEQQELDRLHRLGTVPQPRNKQKVVVPSCDTRSYQIRPCTRDDIYDATTGEVVFAQYCDNSKCSRCAQHQCRRIARLAAWSLQDAPHVYLMTLTPMSASSWPASRKAYLRANRTAAGGRVEMFSVVERGNLEHAHALIWSERPLRGVSSISVEIKPVERTYISLYRTVLYLLKTVIEGNNLQQHLDLNGGHLIAKTRGAYRGFTGFADVRSAYRMQGGWRRGSVPVRGVRRSGFDSDAFAMRQTVSRPERNGVRGAIRGSLARSV